MLLLFWLRAQCELGCDGKGSACDHTEGEHHPPRPVPFGELIRRGTLGDTETVFEISDLDFGFFCVDLRAQEDETHGLDTLPGAKHPGGLGLSHTVGLDNHQRIGATFW